MRKFILHYFPVLCICIPLVSFVSLYAPVAKAGTAFVINVKDFDATGDGKTDDTAAIQKAAEAASRGTIGFNPGAVYTGASPLLYFPPGHYRISDEIHLGAYANVGSDSKAIIEQTDKSKRIFVFAGAYQIEVRGLRFIGGKNQIYYSNKNLDISTIHIDNCEFTFSSDYAIYTIGTWKPTDTHLSCLMTISRSRFVYPNKVLYNVCDSAVIRDCWVQIGSRNFDDNSAAFYNNGASLYLDNMFGVPVFGKDWKSHVRWIDASSNGRVIIDRSRFGGEDAGIPIIYYSAKPETAFPFMGGQVSIVNSQLSVGATMRPDSGVLILDGGMPALLVIRDNTWLVHAPYIRTNADFNLKEFLVAYPQKNRFKIQIGPNAAWPVTAAIPDELMPFLNYQDVTHP